MSAHRRIPDVFTTERLRARPLSLDDGDACFEIYGDADVTRYVTSDGAAVQSIDIVRLLLTSGMLAPQEDSRFGFWGLERLEDEQVVGTVALIPVEDAPDEYEMGWHLARRAWGAGYARESGIALLRYGFDVVGLERIEALTRPENARSIAACRRVGMRDVGMREHQGMTHAWLTAERATWRPPD